MSLMEPFWKLFEIDIKDFTKEEKILLEIELFVQILIELKENYRSDFEFYHLIFKLNKDMENAMLEIHFLPLIINDIVSTGEYTLMGLAHYTNIPEDALYEIISGRNQFPSAILFRKIIELHRSVRKELYDNIIKKIITKYQN